MNIDVKELKEKYPAIKELTPEEQKQLFIMMDAFRESAQTTVKGADSLFKMCDGCAFKKETEANNHPATTLKAVECTLKEEAFFCHKRFGIGGNEKLCNGWINVMNNK